MLVARVFVSAISFNSSRKKQGATTPAITTISALAEGAITRWVARQPAGLARPAALGRDQQDKMERKEKNKAQDVSLNFWRGRLPTELLTVVVRRHIGGLDDQLHNGLSLFLGSVAARDEPYSQIAPTRT